MAKDSNYNNEIEQELKQDQTEKPKLSSKQIERIASWAVLVAIIVGIIASLSFCFGPKYTYVEMDFGDFGKIVLKIDERNAPVTAQRFLDLVKDGFYDGTTIFRAQKDLVIQGGKDVSGSIPSIKGEFESNGKKNKISHTRGVISMARLNGADSATTQFFITLSDKAAESLDGNYAAFGYVVEGMNVVDDIADCLNDHKIDLEGFVPDKDSIKIVSARILKNYKEHK